MNLSQFLLFITGRITIYYNSSIKSLGIRDANLLLKEFLMCGEGLKSF